MKKLVLALVMVLSSQSVFAKKVTKTISPSEFINLIGKEYYHVQFDGDLEDLDASCVFNTGKTVKGHDEVFIAATLGDKDIHLGLAAMSGDQIKMVIETEGDNYQKTFTWGIGGVYQMVITHSDDAYDYTSLSNGMTKLTCGNWY